MKNLIITLLLAFSFLGQSNARNYSIKTLEEPPIIDKKEYQLSTHILDVNKGVPAKGVKIELYKKEKNNWKKIQEGITDQNGRIKEFLPEDNKTDNKGIYKLSFQIKEYFDKQKLNSIYPLVEVIFEIKEDTHYHIPLTISANSYSTYRGN